MVERIFVAIVIGLPLIGIALLLIYGVTGWQLPVYDGGSFGMALVFLWFFAAFPVMVKHAP